MRQRKVIVPTCLVGLLLAIAAPASQAAITFDGPTSSRIEHHVGNAAGSVLAGMSNFSAAGSASPSLVFPGITLNNPMSIGSGNTTYGNGGVDHFTISDPSGNGFHYANIAFAYGSGVTQTAGGTDLFVGPSRVTIPFDLTWSLDDLATTLFAYQFLNVQFATSKLGDTAGVDGTFIYELDLDSDNNVDNTTTLLLSESVTNASDSAESTVVPLFAFDVLRGSPVPTGNHTLRLHGMLEFSASDDEAAMAILSGPPILDTPTAVIPGPFAALQDALAGEFGLLGDQDLNELMMIQGGGIAHGIVIPEPMTGSILGLGLLGLAASRRRRRIA